MHSPSTCPSSSSSTCLPPPSLSKVLQAIAILVGQNASSSTSQTSSSRKIGQPKPTLSSILSTRLQLLSTLELSLPISVVEKEEEEELQFETGKIGLELLKLVSSLSTSTSTHDDQQQQPPLFSINQTKQLQMLSGIISRWLIGSSLSKLSTTTNNNILPNQFRLPTTTTTLKTGGKGNDRLVEIDETEEMETIEELKKIVKNLMGIIREEPQRQLRGILMPQLLLPLIGTIIQLSSIPTPTRLAPEQEQKEVLDDYLKTLFSSNSISSLLSTLLQLLPNTKPSSTERQTLIKHLSETLLRPGGVRSLLIVVIGLQDDETTTSTREKKLEMIWNLLASTTSTTSSRKEVDHFENVLKQLFEILSHSANSNLLQYFPPPLPTSSSFPSPPPPSSIVSATSYLIIHFLLLLSSSLSNSPRNLIQTRFHSSLLPLSYYYYPYKKTKTKTTTTTTKVLLQDVTKLSILIGNTPPHLFEPVLNLLVKPILPVLFSCLIFLHRSRETREEEGVKNIQETGKSSSKNKNKKENQVLKEEIESLLYVYGKHSTSTSTSSSSSKSNEVVEEEEEFSKILIKTIETIENRKEFGDIKRSTTTLLSEEEEEEDKGYFEFEWKVNKTSGGIELGPKLGVEEEEEELGNRGIPFPTLSSSSPLPTATPLEMIDLSIEPQVFIDFMKQLNCKKLNSTIFLRWLDELRVLKSQEEETSSLTMSDDRVEKVELAKKSVTRLQLILKMVEELGSEILSIEPSGGGGAQGGGSGGSSEPEKIIGFVGSILDVGETSKGSKSSRRRRRSRRNHKEKGKGLTMEDWKIVDEDQDDDEEEGVDDDDDEREFGIIDNELGVIKNGNQEMIMTALTLLLAVLEANESLTISNTPLLLSIDSKLAQQQQQQREETDDDDEDDSSGLITPLINEVRTVLKLRETSLKFTSTPTTTTTKGKEKELDGMESSRIQYQTSLKLLQDPLLPVRAQGLHLLKTLIKPNDSSKSTNSSSVELLKTDPALLPGILSIFLNSLTSEEDSFLYLNSIQGLSTLVDVFGKQVINGLLEAYTGSRTTGSGRGGEIREVGKGEKGQKELDKRLRIGEALIQVVQRSGQALSTLQEYLLPPLLQTLRESNLPIPLRSSSITILATMVETAPIAMFDRLGELGESMRTLLEVETVSFTSSNTTNSTATTTKQELEEKKEKQQKEKGKGKGKGSVLIQEMNSSSSSDSDSDEEAESLFSNLKLPTPSPTTAANSKRPEELPDPLTTISKHPSLRRAALLFLSLLVRTSIKSKYELIEKFEKEEMRNLGESLIRDGKLRLPSSQQKPIDLTFNTRGNGAGGLDMEIGIGIGRRESERLKITLNYLRETDRDELVRFQAGQVLEEMEEAGL
ncbi:hypothetical protein JCM5350_008016 [Sporobolomyces pararoseus]